MKKQEKKGGQGEKNEIARKIVSTPSQTRSYGTGTKSSLSCASEELFQTYYLHYLRQQVSQVQIVSLEELHRVVIYVCI